ncbi:hypothetical protein [Acinetobacter larvae]|uniref:Transcriptional regulator SutA RNAP-binding domain-containing protein n=1 Tax=Acinetobacter larvae TaxID=1789224 RepID=A0A1B2LZ33_9GAMM|nr:hypothetical protein [Acinetobacter larvae]AOA58195.1 hypothetical protein BFG52_07410 [Acinetobacter larvae]
MIHQKQLESAALAAEVEKFLAKGGKVDVLPRSHYVTFRSPCFDKSKSELAALARNHKRKTFSYWCDEHGICLHNTKTGACVRCGAKS